MRLPRSSDASVGEDHEAGDSLEGADVPGGEARLVDPRGGRDEEIHGGYHLAPTAELGQETPVQLLVLTDSMIDPGGTGPVTTPRREFLKLVAGAAGVVAFGTTPRALAATERLRADAGGAHPRALRILILGGTGFIGPHQVRYARERGHELTLFNRGRTNPHLFPGVEKLRGDRNGDLAALEGRRWDVVIDNSASNHHWVRMSAGLLRDAVERYIYVSSLSAYSDMSRIGIDVDAPTFTYETAGVSPDAEELPYGLRKALSEREARAALGERATVVRPGLIVGPRDPTDRFTYWPVRIHRGGEVLAPGTPGDPSQIVDARDLAGWMIRLAENDTAGTFNAVQPPRPFAQLLYGIRAITTEPTTFTWVDADFLAEMEVRPWADMPVWVPPEGDTAGFARFDVHRAVEAGLTFRPLAETARDTLEWHFTRPSEEREALRAGLGPEREAEVLAAWHERTSGS